MGVRLLCRSLKICFKKCGSVLTLTIAFGVLISVWMSGIGNAWTGEIAPGDEPAADSPSDHRSFSEALDREIERYIQMLSQEQGMESWRNATWKRYPLGPGLKSWLVLVLKDSEEIGYLVVTGDNSTFHLAEYGSGKSPLFSANTFRQALELQGIKTGLDDGNIKGEMHYAGAFQAVWKVGDGTEALYLDAVTGEWFPLDDASVKAAERDWNHLMAKEGIVPAANGGVKKRLRLPSFDPFVKLNWVDNQALAVSTSSALMDLLSETPTGPEDGITFTARLFGQRVTVPLAITGFDLWEDGQVYVRIDHFGERYIPFALFQQFGEFYGERTIAKAESWYDEF